jgi:hypothetical protein
MGLFGFLKNTSQTEKIFYEPYRDSSTNLIYNLLFCDNLELYKMNSSQPYNYPFDILFSETSKESEIQKIIDDNLSDTRVKILAYNKQIKLGHKSNKKELLAVIVEIGLDNGLDVLASFSNGTARYINQTGKILIWETTDDNSNKLTKDLFVKSQNIVEQIGPWENPRRPYPSKGNVRITFLVSDGLYFGEASSKVLFNDPLASPALVAATELMKYLTEKSLDKN